MGQTASKPSSRSSEVGPQAKLQQSANVESVVPVVSQDFERAIETWRGLSHQELDVEAFCLTGDYMLQERSLLKDHLDATRKGARRNTTHIGIAETMGATTSQTSLTRPESGPPVKRQKRESVEMDVVRFPVASPEDVETALETWRRLANQEPDFEALPTPGDSLVKERTILKGQLDAFQKPAQPSRTTWKRVAKAQRVLKAQAGAVDQRKGLLPDGSPLPVTRVGLRGTLTNPYQRSNRTFINKLPTELQVAIFQYSLGLWFAVPSAEAAQRYLCRLFELMHVCRGWKQVIQDHSGLWRISLLRFIPLWYKDNFLLANEILRYRKTQTLMTYIMVSDDAFSPLKCPTYTSKPPKAYHTPPDASIDLLTETMVHSVALHIRGLLLPSGKLLTSNYAPAFTTCLPSLRTLTWTNIKLRTDVGCALCFVPNLERLSAHRFKGLFDADEIMTYKDRIRLDKLHMLSIFSPGYTSLPGLGHLFRLIPLPALREVVFHNQTRPGIYELLSGAVSIESLDRVQLGPGWDSSIKEVVKDLCRLPIRRLVVKGIVFPWHKTLSGRERLVSIGTLVEDIGEEFPANGPTVIEFDSCALAPSRLLNAIASAQGCVGRGRAVPAVQFRNCYLLFPHNCDFFGLYNWARQTVQTAGLGWIFKLVASGLPYSKRTAVPYRIDEDDTPETEDQDFCPNPDSFHVNDEPPVVDDVEMFEHYDLEEPRGACYTPLD